MGCFKMTAPAGILFLLNYVVLILHILPQFVIFYITKIHKMYMHLLKIPTDRIMFMH